MTILVTGATGQLGAPTIAALRAGGNGVRGLSSRGGTGIIAANLLTGDGVDAALAGMETVVHVAATNTKKDIALTENLVASASRAGVGHLLIISIVGIESIPIPFYRDRLAIEEIVAASGIPFTILRATQFHSFVDNVYASQRFSPVVVGPAARSQPIAVEEVAGRLAELAVGGPRGRVADIGGPEQLTNRETYRLWKNATGGHRPGISIRIPGKIFAAYDAGKNLAAGTPFGRRTFSDYLAGRYPATGSVR
jgi:uncharacterized protein YbjT (DUF2867 family)